MPGTILTARNRHKEEKVQGPDGKELAPAGRCEKLGITPSEDRALSLQVKEQQGPFWGAPVTPCAGGSPVLSVTAM